MPAAQFGRVEMLAARQQAAAGADLQPVGVELRLRLAERGDDRQQLLRRKGVGDGHRRALWIAVPRSEEHTSALQSLMRSSYSVFCLKHKSRDRGRAKRTAANR